MAKIIDLTRYKADISGDYNKERVTDVLFPMLIDLLEDDGINHTYAAFNIIYFTILTFVRDEPDKPDDDPYYKNMEAAIWKLFDTILEREGVSNDRYDVPLR